MSYLTTYNNYRRLYRSGKAFQLAGLSIASLSVLNIVYQDPENVVIAPQVEQSRNDGNNNMAGKTDAANSLLSILYGGV